MYNIPWYIYIITWTHLILIYQESFGSVSLYNESSNIVSYVPFILKSGLLMTNPKVDPFNPLKFVLQNLNVHTFLTIYVQMTPWFPPDM